MESIKSGRASPTIFNHLEVKAYGEDYPLGDLATTIVQGTNIVVIKVFDDSVKEEVMKALQRSEFEVNLQVDGKDIKVKLGTSRKELIAAGLKKIKESNEVFLKEAREARHNVNGTLKKLKKVLPEDLVKSLEEDIAKLLKKAEDVAKKTIADKEKELNSV